MLQRLESRKKVRVKNAVFGGPRMLQCIPLISADQQTFLADLQTVSAYQPDIVEWRIDYFDQLENPDHAAQTLNAATSLLKPLPIILTFRRQSEGGYCFYPDQIRAAVLKSAIDTGLIDVIDIELSAEDGFRNAMLDYAHKKGVKVILSWHNVRETPSREDMLFYLKEEERLGADIAKLSVKPNSFHDVLSLMKASLYSRQEQIGIPQITVSKDDLGLMTRVFGYGLGSDLAFLSVTGVSTFGQLSLPDFRELLSLLQLEDCGSTSAV